MEPSGRGRTILIVDDDRFLIDMYGLKFRENGFTVEAAQGGAEALRRLRDGLAPDAILLDVVMPGLDGFGLLEAIKKENLAPGATVIVLSNQGQDADRERAKELCADRYIIKASTVPSEVLREVSEALGSPAGTPEV